MHSLAYGQAMAAAARDYQKVRRAIQADLGHFSCAIGCISHQHVHIACAIYEPVCAMQEMQSESRASVQEHGRNVDVDDLLDDPELERPHAERLATMQQEAEKRAQLQRKGHGEYQEARL